MIIVPVKEGENIERAIKKFKRKFDKTGVVTTICNKKESRRTLFFMGYGLRVMGYGLANLRPIISLLDT